MGGARAAPQVEAGAIARTGRPLPRRAGFLRPGALSDVQNALDGFAVVYQHALTAGTPLLFLYHLLCRHWLTGRFLPWLLLPAG